MLSSPTYQSLDSVDSILKEVRLVNGMTATATLWDCPEVMDKALEKGRVEEDIKSIGIGALPGFVGGSIEVASVIELSEASGWVAAGLFMTEG